MDYKIGVKLNIFEIELNRKETEFAYDHMTVHVFRET